MIGDLLVWLVLLPACVVGDIVFLVGFLDFMAVTAMS